MKEKILEGAHSLFVQFGVRSISMDDVAKELSVSKKTLYQHFKNKDELVTEAVRLHMEGEKQEFELISDESANAIQELFKLSKCMREHVFKVNPSLLFDLQKFHPEAWKVFQSFKDNTIKRNVMDNMVRGIKEGYYRPNIDPRVLATIRMEVVQMVFNNHIFPRDQFDFVAVQIQVFDHFVYGLLTDKGRKEYEHYLTEENKSHD